MTISEQQRQSCSILAKRRDVLLRLTVMFNLLLMALSWSSWFEGSEHEIGTADRLFGGFRLSGFRGDLVWLFFSTAVLTLPFIYFVIRARENRRARFNAVWCLVGILAFCLFVYHVLTGGLLYFG
jgi:hypothetical protein